MAEAFLYIWKDFSNGMFYIGCHNGLISKMSYNCPEGFVPGRVSWKKVS